MELFEATYPSYVPLAERLRPKTLEDVAGVPERIQRIAKRVTEASAPLPSLLLWGPPGVGKTTISRLLAEASPYPKILSSAVSESMREVRARMEEARKTYRTIILLLDEIHRFNKAQQDAFLGAVESGQVILLGATTENPWSYLNRALLSRLEVVRLYPLSEEALSLVLKRALLAVELNLSEPASKLLLEASHGDARELLKRVEALSHVVGATRSELSKNDVERALGSSELLKRSTSNDNDRSSVVSAFIKSLRGSSPDGALYWAFRLLKMGEDARFLFRRMIIFASEDIGNADPRALELAVSALEGYEKIGEPEGRILLSHCITYLASVPKSNEAYQAYRRAEELVERFPDLAVPASFVPGSREYKNPHKSESGFVEEDYLPQKIRNERLYRPGGHGFEVKIQERLERLWGKDKPA